MKKRETLYVISGQLRATYLDLDSGDYLETVLGGGDLVVVEPGCAHVYDALRHSQAIELSSEPYDPRDTVAISVAEAVREAL